MANRVPVTVKVTSDSALGCFDEAENAARKIALASNRTVYLQEMFFEYIHRTKGNADQWEGRVTFHFDVESKDPMDITNADIVANADMPEPDMDADSRNVDNLYKSRDDLPKDW